MPEHRRQVPKERLHCRVFTRSQDVALAISQAIADLIRTRQVSGESCALGLATGSTPVDVYKELVRMHRDEGLSFKNVFTFNLDEYHPMQPHELQSYVRFMREHLFNDIDIPEENIHIPDGTISVEDVAAYCHDYEEKIAAVGGIDIQILGIGRTGHIGFNEPGSDEHSSTRLITLDRVTRTDAASDFFGIEHVPRRAITMGVGTILKAKQIFMIAFGENKAEIVARTVEGNITPSIPATYLQLHDNVHVMLDEAAAESLSPCKSPWLHGPVEWTPQRIRKAVIWLAEHVKKPILKLTESDYNEEGLQNLLTDHGSAYDINLTVFRHLQSTITGWPGGKPSHLKLPGDHTRPRDKVFPKRILVFSPHPDDDAISMGGTIIRLAAQEHDVHIAYQTSGNIAVFDDDTIRAVEFVSDYCDEFHVQSERIHELEKHVDEFLRKKHVGQMDSPEVRKIKGLVRQSEARAAARCCGVEGPQLHFLNMPFYESGRVKKNELSQADFGIIETLLREIRPHQIYAAGDLSDPHGTHRTCLRAILEAYNRCENDQWRSTCEIWLYRGAWQEWSPHRIEMAVPLSPQEVERKRVAIFKHESQKDRALFPGPDMREFWQRAEERNAATARRYDALGLAEYEAIEGFVQWQEGMVV
jgi:glucosamine-6-phosphate deaminase